MMAARSNSSQQLSVERGRRQEEQGDEPWQTSTTPFAVSSLIVSLLSASKRTFNRFSVSLMTLAC